MITPQPSGIMRTFLKLKFTLQPFTPPGRVRSHESYYIVMRFEWCRGEISLWSSPPSAMNVAKYLSNECSREWGTVFCKKRNTKQKHVFLITETSIGNRSRHKGMRCMPLYILMQYHWPSTNTSSPAQNDRDFCGRHFQMHFLQWKC